MKHLLAPRPAQLYDLPLSVDCPILRPEQVILRFPHGKTIDVGALCYLVRDFAPANRTRRQADGRKVELASLCPSRTQQIQKLINQISEDVQHSGLRAESLRDTYSRFVAFMAWADTQGWQQVLAESAQAQAVAKVYINHLRERIRRLELTNNSAARQQVAVLTVLGAYHAIEDLGRGLNLLYTDQAEKESTVPPCEIAQSQILSLCESLFTGLCDLVLGPKTFPHGITMPTYLGLPDNTLWVFPSISWFMSPAMLAERHTLWCPGWAYDYVQGRLATLAELRAVNALPGLAGFAGDCDIRRRSMLREARRQLEAANNDAQHCQRRQLAFQAMNTFCILFLAETGMNWAQLTQLSWADNFEVDASHQAFRTIKWRAGGKLVSFELPIAVMPAFKKYLALRKFLLNGRDCDMLFFKQGTKGRETAPEAIKGNLDPVYAMLKRIDPSLVPITSREWRAAKSDWLVRNTDPATAAVVLQNTEKTVLKSYAAGSETTHLAEMSDFLNEVALRVLPRDEPVEGGVPRAVGVCAAYGTPEPIGPGVIRPDCKGPEGCLFCDKFKVHADAKDTRKLISCRFCLQQSAPLAGSAEQVRGLLGPIFDRIEVILTEVRKRDAAMVEQVGREVEEDGELDPYWAQKYEMLLSLGAVA